MNEWYVNQNTVILYKTTNKTKSHYYIWPMAKTHLDMLFHLKMFIVNLKFEKKIFREPYVTLLLYIITIFKKWNIKYFKLTFILVWEIIARFTRTTSWIYFTAKTSQNVAGIFNCYSDYIYCENYLLRASLYLVHVYKHP